MEPNRDRLATAMEEYLEMQDVKSCRLLWQMYQSKYGAIPCGWKRIDIAAVAADFYSQKVTIKYAGNTIQPDGQSCRICSAKSEIGKTSISKRKNISATMMRDVKKRCSEYFDIMDVPG